MRFADHLRRRGAVLSQITAEAVAEHGDTDRAYALAAARYGVVLGLPMDPPTWEAAGLLAGWSQDQGEA